MSAKDTKAKQFISNPERFADIINFFVFDGQRVVNPEELVEQDSTEVLSVFGVSGKEVHKQKWRDLLKHAVVKYGHGTCYVLFGIENQSEIHYAMPVKNLIYDALNYGSQVDEASRKLRKGSAKNSAEFLSGFAKDAKLTPVITITLYLGADRWDGPRTLHEMMAVSDSHILKFVPDNNINLIAPGEITDFSKFHSSMREVLEIMKASNSRDAMQKLIKNNPRFTSIGREELSAINVFAGLNWSIDEGKEDIDMCKAWEEQFQDGVQLGMQQGVQQGLQQGIQRTHFSFVQDGIISVECAAEKLGLTVDEFEKEMSKAGYRVPERV